MKLEILMSCMHQKDGELIRVSGITGDGVVINQCDRNGFAQIKTAEGCVRMYDTTQRGLTRSRNMAIAKSEADVCLLCDDDEVFVVDYQRIVTQAYERLPQADVIVFKMVNRPPSFSERVQRLRFPKTMKVSSWQISFRRESLLKTGVRFDELMGAGSGNGAEEELKFLTDCEKAGLKIYYVPEAIATVAQTESTWFSGFNQKFFENRGATTRYILGWPLALVYGVYYIVRKKPMYRDQISPGQAWKALWRGICDNKIGKLAANKDA